MAELVDGFAYLEALPLSNAEIGPGGRPGGPGLVRASRPRSRKPALTAGQDSIAGCSEILLASIDRLTEHLERGMQAMVR